MAILGLLSGKQSFFVDKMSQLIIRESSDFGKESRSSSDFSDWKRDRMDYARAMTFSKKNSDKRFIKLYKIRKAHEIGIHIGFDLNDNMVQRRTLF